MQTLDEKTMTESQERALAWPWPRRRAFERTLRKAAREWFVRNQIAVQRSRPFTVDQWANWRFNIILPEVSDYLAAEKIRNEDRGTQFRLHKFLHHGLSSQAMLFNLVGPLIVRRDLAPLRETFGALGLHWPAGAISAEFEYDDRSVFNDDPDTPTSADLVIKDMVGAPRIFIEAKLTEPDFGHCLEFLDGNCEGGNPAANLDDCFLHFIGRRYWELLRKHGLLRGPIGTQALCPLANHYQFYRQLLFALEKNGPFVLLCDERSPAFQCRHEGRLRGLMPVLTRILPEEVREMTATLTVQQLVASIEQSGRHGWIGEFKSKYGLDRES